VFDDSMHSICFMYHDNMRSRHSICFMYHDSMHSRLLNLVRHLVFVCHIVRIAKLLLPPNSKLH
jgi:hypothetical protein